MWNRKAETLQLEIGVTITGQSMMTLASMLRTVVTEALERNTRFMQVGGVSIPIPSEPPDYPSLLLDKKQTANLLRLSARTVDSMTGQKRMPEPVRLGKSVRWRYDELKAWTEAGCPPQRSWNWRPGQ